MANTPTAKPSFDIHANGTATNPPASPGAQPSSLSPANSVGTTPKEVYDYYSRLQMQMQFDFQRDLAKAAGLNVSQAASTGFDTGMHIDATRENVVEKAHAGTGNQMPAESLIAGNDESSPGSSDDVAADDDSSATATSSNTASATEEIATGQKLEAPVPDAVLNGNGPASRAAAPTAGPNGARGRKVEPPQQRDPRTSHKQVSGRARRGINSGRNGGPTNGGIFLGGRKYIDMDAHDEDHLGTPKVRASKLEYKRLDHLYSKNNHDFYLTESTKSPGDKDDAWEEYIFVVRRRFGTYASFPFLGCKTNRSADWQNKYQATTVDIKSSEIIDVLREILKDVRGVSLHEDKPSVRSAAPSYPFSVLTAVQYAQIDPNLLFNYLGALSKVLENEKALPEDSQNKARIEHLALLCEYIEADYQPVTKRLYPLLQHNEITFDLLWALFLPNTILYTLCPGSNEPRCVMLNWGAEKRDHQRGETFFSLDCHYVDYDGKSFGEAKAILELPEFFGSRPIDSLPVFPLAYHEDKETVNEKLVARGRKFGALSGMHYRFYKGLAFFKKKQNLVRLTVDSRIIVDPLTFKRMNPNYSMSAVKPGAGSYFMEEFGLDLAEGDFSGTQSGYGSIDFTGYNDKALTSITSRIADRELARRGRRPTTARGPSKQSLVPEQMTDEQLLLCSATVLGFSFGDKLWAEFAVDHIREIVFNPGAFDSLVLPESQKTIVKALVESHSGKAANKKTPGIDDIIRGKGKGLVAVLHGRPGVGKTLTAEGISEYLKKPLYMVSAGELGTDSRQLEAQLSRILDMCYGWGAVLLLDEADVFLERRSVHELQRNALVSVFLRLLEYFQGILFLTTNRVETFDEAFQSRIHIALRYNDLDRKAKRIIWKTFLDMVASEELTLLEDDGGGTDKMEMDPKPKLRQIVTGEELEVLSRRNLNGRQVCHP
jgi:hypothetical protein